MGLSGMPSALLTVDSAKLSIGESRGILPRLFPRVPPLAPGAALLRGCYFDCKFYGVTQSNRLEYRQYINKVREEHAAMKAADVMVPKVITVGVDATIGEVADTLLSHHISGAPVVGEKGELVGIVSEGDLMRRPETGTERRPSWWLALLSSDRASATEYIKSHSRKVADVMTREVISAGPDTSLGDIAAMLERNRIKRVPILDGGKLVGIVTRANILQALASAAKKLPSLATP